VDKLRSVDRFRQYPNNEGKGKAGGVRILLSGLSGTGSTTAAKRIAADAGLKYVYGGQIFRNLAAERGISLEELVELLEAHPEIEEEIDQRLVEAAMAGDVLVESRTVGWLFPREVHLVDLRSGRATPPGAASRASSSVR
jgi:adenylate kinase family enzyme